MGFTVCFWPDSPHHEPPVNERPARKLQYVGAPKDLVGITPQGVNEVNDVIFLGWDQAPRQHRFDPIEAPWPHTNFEATVFDLAGDEAESIKSASVQDTLWDTIDAHPESEECAGETRRPLNGGNAGSAMTKGRQHGSA